MRYSLPCGCSFNQKEERIKEYDGLPPIEIDYYNIPLDCAATWDLISSGRTRGIFQLESNLGRSYAKKLEPDNMDHLAALTSLLRPGCLASMLEGKSMTNHFVDRKQGIEETKYVDESVEQYLNETYGIMTYQEQLIAIAKGVAGYTPEMANKLRKCVTDDTRFVSKTRGWISIKTLLKEGYENDLFLVMNENGIQSWKKIVKIWKSGNKAVNDVRCDSGMSVKATNNHQFLTSDGWKARSRLKLNDRIISVSEVEWDGVDKISEDMAILIAGLITEGYFIDKNTATFTNYNKEMLEIFKNAYIKEFGVVPTTSNNNILISMENKRKIAKILDFGKSDNKRIPNVMMGMTKDTTRKFLAFMINAESGITEKTGMLEYSSKSKECIEQIHLLLLRFGIYSYIHKRWNDEYNCFYYRLYINDVDNQKKIIKEFGELLLTSKRNSIIQNLDRRDEYKGFTGNTVPHNIVIKLINQYPFVANGEGGSVYNQDISWDRFIRLCKRSKDNYWINLSHGKHRYASIKSLDEHHDQVCVYDFTIEGQDTPYIIANGMVIHNCLGKKDVAELYDLQESFVVGCMERGLTKEKGTQIFEDMKASGRYIFNKSHAYEYGNITYLTAYMKAHFPLHFFCAYLKFVEDNDELRELLAEMSLFNIMVKTPSIYNLSSRFTIKDGYIQYGYGEVKSIGINKAEKFIDNIIEKEKEVNKPIAEFTWYEFLIHIASITDTTTIYNLISSGLLDHLNMSRAKQIKEYKTFTELTGKSELQWIKEKWQDYNSLTDLIDALLKAKEIKTVKKQDVEVDYLNSARRQRVQSLYNSLVNPSTSMEDTTDSICDAENVMLGRAISRSKTADKERFGNLKCLEFCIGRGYNNFRIVAEVADVDERLIKNGKNAGKQFANIKLRDTSGEIECTLFSDDWDKFKTDMTKGNVLLVSGHRNKDKTLKIDDLQLL